MGRKVTRTPATGPDVRARGLDSETLGRSIGQCLSVKGPGLGNSSKVWRDIWRYLKIEKKVLVKMMKKIGGSVWKGNS